MEPCRQEAGGREEVAVNFEVLVISNYCKVAVYRSPPPEPYVSDQDPGLCSMTSDIYADTPGVLASVGSVFMLTEISQK